MVLITRSTRARTQSQENDAQLGVKGGLKKTQAAGNKRRVLGDVSNVVVSRDQGAKGKEPAVKAKPGSALLEVPTSKAAATRAAATKAAAAKPAAAKASAEAPPPVKEPSPVALRTRGATSRASLDGGRRASTSAAGSRRSSGASAALPDIDKMDCNNVMAATDYVCDMYTYFKRIEAKYRASPNYMDDQADINHKMRAILIDWLADVHYKFKLTPETLYLTVNLTDRYLNVTTVSRKQLQLVGMVAMLIASKYEDIWAPEVKDFVYMCDKAYTREDILSMEKKMLNTLQYKLTLPTQYTFQARFVKAAGVHLDILVSNLCTYLLELSLVKYEMLAFAPSMTATAAAYVALRTLKKSNPYPKNLALHSGYSKADILPCARELVKLMLSAETDKLTAVHRKYSNSKLNEVASLSPPVEILLE